MDVLPSDLVTYGEEAKNLLEDLQSRNERMFLVTVLVMNTAKKRQKLDNNIFQVQGIAQKYNCSLKQLDYQQEAALMSCIPLTTPLLQTQTAYADENTTPAITIEKPDGWKQGETTIAVTVDASHMPEGFSNSDSDVAWENALCRRAGISAGRE